MQKAVSELVVIVIILAIVVTLASLAFLFMSQFTEETKSEVQQSGSEAFKRMRACLEIDGYNFTESYIMVKNCGPVELKNFVIFADGAAIAADNTTMIKTGKTDKIFFEDVPYEGINTIKVTANYGETYDAEEVPKILLIKNVNVSVG